MTLRKISRTLLPVIILIFTSQGLYAQLSNNYYIGNQLYQQQKYEEAYQVFTALHKENPGTFLFLEKAVQCLIDLKRYDDALELAREAEKRPNYPGEASILIGKIYHVKGDNDKAFSVWEEVIEKYENSYQIYLSVARIMTERREFEQAVKVYEQARKKFSSSTLLATELANTYMQAGRYEDAINEFLKLVEKEPERIDYVQRSLLRYGDQFLHDIAILEIDDFLKELNLNHPAHRSLHQLQLWLLLERNLYDRALATARNFEEKTSEATFTLYGLGAKLLSEQQFELAEKAYKYYIENNVYSAKFQSMEELSDVYTEWANYLSEYSLAYTQRRDALYQQAFDILKELQLEAPFYDRMDRVLIKQAELAIDYLHDVDLAKNYLDALRSRKNESTIAQQYYVEGRIKLYEREYARARIAFTKSNKQERIGDLAEKTRYYLALTDFYAGDYEFAKVQLNALERQNTSYFANDAVQLRIWIQKGLNADSTGSIIEPFAKSVELFNQGKNEVAIKKIRPIIKGNAFHPFIDEALLMLSKHVTPGKTFFTYAAIDNYLENWGKVSALRERLLWEKARIADQVVTKDIKIEKPANMTTEEKFYYGTEAKKLTIPTTKLELQKLYEHILMEFPDGFYASYARNRIQELKNPQT